MLLRTTDGGRTWRTQALPLSGQAVVNRVVAASPSEASVLVEVLDDSARSGLAFELRTRDGGRSWEEGLRDDGSAIADVYRGGGVTYLASGLGVYAETD